MAPWLSKNKGFLKHTSLLTICARFFRAFFLCVLVQLSQSHFQSGWFQLLHWVPGLWIVYSCSSNEMGSWTRVTILIHMPNFYIFPFFLYFNLIFPTFYLISSSLCFLPPHTKLLHPKWDLLFSHNINWSCNVSLRPSSSQPSPALAWHGRSAGTHLLPPLLPCTHRWFSTAPLPHLGSNIWGAATAPTMLVYLTSTSLNFLSSMTAACPRIPAAAGTVPSWGSPG